MTELEVRLRHLLDLRGIGLVTGEPGGGETTVCRKVVASLHSGLHRVFYVSLSTGNVMDIDNTIAWELGLPTERSRAALYRVIRAEVTRLCLETRVRPTLIVDDAHYLRSDVLEELRLPQVLEAVDGGAGSASENGNFRGLVASVKQQQDAGAERLDPAASLLEESLHPSSLRSVDPKAYRHPGGSPGLEWCLATSLAASWSLLPIFLIPVQCSSI